MASPIKTLLDNTKVSALMGEDAGPFRIVKPPFTVDARDDVAEVMMKFAKHHFHAAPVWDAEQLKYIGFVGVVDLVWYLLRVTQAMKEHEDPVRLNALATEYSSRPVRELIDASHADPFISVTPETTLTDLLKILASGVHQVAVMTDQQSTGDILAVISQMTVVHWFSDLLHSKPVSALGVNVFKTVTELQNLGLGDVATIPEDAPVRRAFESLALFRISGVAVVDSERRVVDCLTTFDLNGLLLESIGSIMKSVKEYLAPLRSARPVAVITFAKDRPLSAIISRLAETGVHRAWIVDEEGHPVGVVSLTDICEALLNRL